LLVGPNRSRSPLLLPSHSSLLSSPSPPRVKELEIDL
jgi:hypothetical protein